MRRHLGLILAASSEHVDESSGRERPDRASAVRLSLDSHSPWRTLIEQSAKFGCLTGVPEENMFAAGEALEEPYANVVCATAILGRIRAHGLPEIVQSGIEPSVEFGSEERLPVSRGG